MRKVRLTITESKCRCGYFHAGQQYIVEDLCPPLCHELWNSIYPAVFALLNGASLDRGEKRATEFDAHCPDEGRVRIHGEVIEEHDMNLDPEPFAMIKSGQKSIELRLYDEKRQKIKPGDMIVFTNTENGEELTANVKELHRFDSFAELYKSLPLLCCGYTKDTLASADPSDMDRYYSRERQKEYGVVGIEIRLTH